MKRRKTYAELKEDARQTAIAWQQWASEVDLSYGELCFWQDRFERLGRRYGLLAEFRENAII